MKKYYTVTAFKVSENYDNLAIATQRFEEIAKIRNYCELKQVWEDGKSYYSQSIKISHKRG